MEASTGQIIYEKGADDKRSPASVTKVMTLILIFDALAEGKIQLSDEVVTSAHAKSMGGSQVFLEEGDVVKAGELLGYMGDTGYSKVEGTTGNFDVHLHVGIYFKTDHFDELSVDPYWILKYLEKYRFTYRY